MRYIKFHIQNFKGIKDAVVDLDDVSGAAVYAMVGLNESGKTTLLQAMHSFSPEFTTDEISGERELLVAKDEPVPRHLISEFTDTVSVKATVSLDKDEFEKICDELKNVNDFKVDRSYPKTRITFDRWSRYERGDLKEEGLRIVDQFLVKKKGDRKWRAPHKKEQDILESWFYWSTPDIAYFPTFIFDIPKQIYISGSRSDKDKFYASVFQDILDFDGRGFKIKNDILDRVRSEQLSIPWLDFLGLWRSHSDRDKIQHIMDRSGAAVTKLVMGRWSKIFGEDISDKEIVIPYDLLEGEIIDSVGNVTKTDKHDFAISFMVKDGTRRFNVNERSLGFRWFFAFMLFTQFRAARSTDVKRPVLFLFDEPASNLHAAAQQRLIESFPEIAVGGHMLVYTTHSHYMIEPKWLEQTFIVTNRSDKPAESFRDELSLDDESLDIKAMRYRQFANDNPEGGIYFQPIIDRLEVTPSRFDYRRPAIVLEGKSDYYIVRYLIALLGTEEIPLIPAVGAGTFDSLLAQHVGWNLNLHFVLDSDKQGTNELERYVREYLAKPGDFSQIASLCDGASEIEDLLDTEGLERIKIEIGESGTLSKKQILRFMQEKLASNQVVDLGDSFREKGLQLVTALREKLPAQ